jgi:integrase
MIFATPHDLRHTFATWLREAGVDPMTVAQLLGHRVHAMTGRYAHLTAEQRKRAIEKLPHFSKKKESPRNVLKVKSDEPGSKRAV